MSIALLFSIAAFLVAFATLVLVMWQVALQRNALKHMIESLKVSRGVLSLARRDSRNSIIADHIRLLPDANHIAHVNGVVTNWSIRLTEALDEIKRVTYHQLSKDERLDIVRG